MTGKRLRLTTILAGLLLSGMTLIAWTQQWVSVTVIDGATLDVGGDVAAPALSALSLAGLALIGALTVAGPVFRVILAVLEASLGALIVYSGVTALNDPIAAAAPSITEVTGRSGIESIRTLVSAPSVTAWPVVTIVLGALLVVLAVAVLVTSRRWPAAGSKYQAVRLESADAETSNIEASTVDSWDALSGGDDPTQR
ncbi:MAG: Trp biosynthesis-associated membrane protein [Rhodoglobus sp.]